MNERRPPHRREATARRRRKSVAPLLGLIALAVAACGGAATAPPGRPASTATGAGFTPPIAVPTNPLPGVGGADFDACALLTGEEIETVTGFTVLNATPGPQLGIFPAGCEWELEGDVVSWSVTAGVITPGGRSYFDTYFAPFEGTPIQGLGDVALQLDKDDVMAVKGDTLVDITYIQFGEHENVAEELMRLALAKV